MRKDILSNYKKIDIEEYKLVDAVVNSRPLPYREYDQIYMVSTDMIIQAKLVIDFLKDKRVVFLGDGDGMSILFLLLMQSNKFKVSKEMMVMDFDERIINNYKSFFDKSPLRNKTLLRTRLYNVLNPIDEDIHEHFDFFYINPPYGSQNNGNSCIVWLYRCMQLCLDKARGCIIIPYDKRYKWSIKNMESIQSFLVSHGFIICNMLENIHSYYLDDNPELKSSMLIVERRESKHFLNNEIPENLIHNLYGGKRPYPQFIRDNGQPLGECDFSWRYGDKAY